MFGWGKPNPRIHKRPQVPGHRPDWASIGLKYVGILAILIASFDAGKKLGSGSAVEGPQLFNHEVAPERRDPHSGAPNLRASHTEAGENAEALLRLPTRPDAEELARYRFEFDSKLTATPPSPDTWLTYGTEGKQVTLDVPVDGQSITAAAWIRPSQNDNVHLRSILSNRYAGCASDEEHAGYTFFINEWEKGSRRLVLEWSQGSQCQTIMTAPEAIPLGVWTHVAFAMHTGDTKGSKPAQAMLFINGELVTHRSYEYGRAVQTHEGLRIGSIPDTDGFVNFRGPMANVVVFNGILGQSELQAVYRASRRDDFEKLMLHRSWQDRILMQLGIGRPTHETISATVVAGKGHPVAPDESPV